MMKLDLQADEFHGLRLTRASREIVSRARHVQHEVQDLLDRTQTAIERTHMLISRSDELLERIPGVTTWDKKRL